MPILFNDRSGFGNVVYKQIKHIIEKQRTILKVVRGSDCVSVHYIHALMNFAQLQNCKFLVQFIMH